MGMMLRRYHKVPQEDAPQVEAAPPALEVKEEAVQDAPVQETKKKQRA